MILALAHPKDDLVRAIGEFVEVTTARPEELEIAWQSPGIDGYAVLRGRAISLRELSGVLVRTLPELPGIAAVESDAQYLQMEWTASWLGLLRALPCRVINRPKPLVCYRTPLLYRHAGMFAEAGLRLPRTEVSASGSRIIAAAEKPERLFVAETKVYHAQGGTVAPSLAGRYCRLAALLDLPFLELIAAGDVVTEIHDRPDLSGCDPDVQRQVAGALAAMLGDFPVEARA